MKQMTIIALIATLTAFSYGCSKEKSHDQHSAKPKSTDAATEVLKPQTACPIMGGSVDTTLFVDQNGKRIYVCCTGCLETVKNDFAAAEKALEKVGQKPESIK